MQCVTRDIGMTFQEVEDELRDTVLPDLFQGATSQIPGREITGMTVKQARIALPDPMRTAGANCTASYVITGHLVAALLGTDESRSDDHALLMGKGRGRIRQRRAEEEVEI